MARNYVKLVNKTQLAFVPSDTEVIACGVNIAWWRIIGCDSPITPDMLL